MNFLPFLSLLVAIATVGAREPITVTWHDRAYTITGPTTLHWETSSAAGGVRTEITTYTKPFVSDVVIENVVTGYTVLYRSVAGDYNTTLSQ